MTLFAVTAVGADRPGIVAAVANALESVNGNIEDAAMQALGGQFAISLLVNVDADAQTLRDTLERAASGLVLTVSEAQTQERAASPTHLFTIYGADRPGLVGTAAAVLFARGANVTNLQSRILPADKPIYVMAFEVSLPEGTDGEAICDIIRDAMPGVQASVNTLERTQL
ncbi:glycine cleavage system protein R [Stomatohabitans albus]|uniref:glycine cleavage system protein R n=1 Tax=Stomatohabitans albus TaxID=3110766 RepID=UPI00300D0394